MNTCGFQNSTQVKNIENSISHLGTAGNSSTTQWRSFKSCVNNDMFKIPIHSDGTLRTTYYGIEVIVIDAQQWGISEQYRYNVESFRFLPAMHARHGSPGIDIMYHTLHYLDLIRSITGKLTPVTGSNMLVSIANIPKLCNAFWTGGKRKGYMMYGNGDNVTMSQLVSADVVAHELTHALTEDLAPQGLIYEGHSGALNESLSDIMATVYEFYLEKMMNYDGDISNNISTTADWYIGEDIVKNGNRKLRDMSNPNICRQPMEFKGEFWADSKNLDYDHGGVHINSGVINYFFYHLVKGTGDILSSTKTVLRVVPLLQANATFQDFAKHCLNHCTCIQLEHVKNALRITKLL